jgi:cytochrome c oxidase cbb3-type subunit 4
MTYDVLQRVAGLGGLLYFIGIFAAVLVYALRPTNKRRFDEAAAIPLRED